MLWCVVVCSMVMRCVVLCCYVIINIMLSALVWAMLSMGQILQFVFMRSYLRTSCLTGLPTSRLLILQEVGMNFLGCSMSLFGRFPYLL